MKRLSQPSMPELVNELFKRYRHPSGREYTHKEVEEGITEAAGKKLIDASYLSKLRTGALKHPGMTAVQALCHFFPVSPDYFFPDVTAYRQRQQARSEGTTPLKAALRWTGADPDLLREQLASLLKALESDSESEQNEAK